MQKRGHLRGLFREWRTGGAVQREQTRALAQIAVHTDRLANAGYDSVPDEEFGTLLEDYVASREDMRSLEILRATVMGLALTVLTILFVVIPVGCRTDSDQCRVFPDYYLAGVPLVPLAMFAYAVIVGGNSVLKSFYCRDLERRLIAKVDHGGGLFWAELEVEASRVSRPTNLLGVLSLVIQVAAIVVFGGFTVSVIMLVAPFWRVLMSISYGAALTLLLRSAILFNFRGRDQYLRLRQRAARAQTSAIGSSRGNAGRKVAFHLFPRRGPNFQAKWSYYATGAVAAAVFTRDPTHSQWVVIVIALGFSLAFDLLLYQARYLANDIRGYEDDLNHPDALRRPRLASVYPQGQWAAAKIGLTNIFIRILLYALFLAIVPRRLWPTLIIGAAFILVIALFYDNFRDHYRDSQAWIIAVYLLAAVGYAFRFVFAFLLYRAFSDASGGLTELVYLSSFVFILGWLTISLSWACEACAHVDAPGLRAGQPIPPTVSISASLRRKPHIAVHLGQAYKDHPPFLGDGNPRGQFSRFLEKGDRPGVAWRSHRLPLTVLTFALAGASVDILTEPTQGWVGPTAAAVSALAGLLCALLSIGWAASVGCIATVSICVAIFTMGHVPLSVALIACLPMAGAWAVNTILRSQSFDEQMHFHIGQLWLPVAAPLTRIADGLLRVLVGVGPLPPAGERGGNEAQRCPAQDTAHPATREDERFLGQRER